MRWQVVQLWSVKSKGREKQAGNNADEEATFNVYIVVDTKRYERPPWSICLANSTHGVNKVKRSVTGCPGRAKFRSEIFTHAAGLKEARKLGVTWKGVRQ